MAGYEELLDSLKMMLKISLVKYDAKTAFDNMRDGLVRNADMTPRAAANLVRMVMEAVRVEYGLDRAYTDEELRQIASLV